MIMKKIVFFLSLVAISLTCRNMNAQTPYLGGSLTAAYNSYFKLDSHFLGGYEFNDKWAVGGGIGLEIIRHIRVSLSYDQGLMDRDTAPSVTAHTGVAKATVAYMF